MPQRKSRPPSKTPKRILHRRLMVEARRDGTYERLLKAQGGVCALCGNPPKEGGVSLNIDTDHKTMTIRGLLCHRCNQLLPVTATPAWLRRAADYIEGSWTPPRSAGLSALPRPSRDGRTPDDRPAA